MCVYNRNMRYERKKKGGNGDYTDKDLENTIEGKEGKKKVLYVLDKDESTPKTKVVLDDIITSDKIVQERAIVINGYVYNVESIFEWVILNNHKEDPYRGKISKEDIERIGETFKKVFGLKEYKKRSRSPS